MLLVSSCGCLYPIRWSQVLSWEWRCSWSSADRRCSNYIWVINNVIAYKSASYIRDLTVRYIPISYRCTQAKSNYLSQWWPRSILPYGVNRPQWVNHMYSCNCTLCIFSSWSIMEYHVYYFYDIMYTHTVKLTLLEMFTDEVSWNQLKLRTSQDSKDGELCLSRTKSEETLVWYINMFNSLVP